MGDKNWGTCVNSNDCFAFAYYNADGAVIGQCSVEALVEDLDKASANQNVLKLKCGSYEDSFVKDSENNLVSVTNSIKITPKSGVLHIEANQQVEVTKVNDIPKNIPFIVKIKFKDKLPNGKESVLKSFKNIDEYEKENWSNIPESAIASKEIYAVKTATVSPPIKKDHNFGNINELKNGLRWPEIFISSSGAFDFNNISAPFFHLANGSKPKFIKGMNEALNVYMENLNQEKSGKTYGSADVEKSTGQFDIGVSFSFPLGKDKTDNDIKKSHVFRNKFAGDFQNAQTSERSNYYSPFGLQLTAHWWPLLTRWFKLGLGLKDEFAYRLADESTANSWLVSNNLGIDIPLTVIFHKHFSAAFNLIDLGYLTLYGNNTLGDTSKKHTATQHELNWQPGATAIIRLLESLHLALGYSYRFPFYQSNGFSTSGEHIVQAGILYVPESEKFAGINEVNAPYTKPSEEKHEIDTKFALPGKPPEPPKEKPLMPAPFGLSKMGSLSVAQNMEFIRGKAELKEGEESKIDQLLINLADKIKKEYKDDLPSTAMLNKMTIIGHASPEASAKENKVLSQNRTAAIRPRIIEKLKEAAKNEVYPFNKLITEETLKKLEQIVVAEGWGEEQPLNMDGKPIYRGTFGGNENDSKNMKSKENKYYLCMGFTNPKIPYTECTPGDVREASLSGSRRVEILVELDPTGERVLAEAGKPVAPEGAKKTATSVIAEVKKSKGFRSLVKSGLKDLAYNEERNAINVVLDSNGYKNREKIKNVLFTEINKAIKNVSNANTLLSSCTAIVWLFDRAAPTDYRDKLTATFTKFDEASKSPFKSGVEIVQEQAPYKKSDAIKAMEETAARLEKTMAESTKIKILEDEIGIAISIGDFGSLKENEIAAILHYTKTLVNPGQKPQLYINFKDSTASIPNDVIKTVSAKVRSVNIDLVPNVYHTLDKRLDNYVVILLVNDEVDLQKSNADMNTKIFNSLYSKDE